MSSPDATLPVSRRVADLLDRMTLDEKLAQLNSQWMRDFLDDSRKLSGEKIKARLALGNRADNPFRRLDHLRPGLQRPGRQYHSAISYK